MQKFVLIQPRTSPPKIRRRISKFAKQKPKDLRRRVGHRGPDAGEERGHVPRLDGRKLLLQLLADVVAHGVEPRPKIRNPDGLAV